MGGEYQIDLGPGEIIHWFVGYGPGEVVGWSWLVPPHQWQFDCRAIDAVRGLAFDAEWLREAAEAVVSAKVRAVKPGKP